MQTNFSLLSNHFPVCVFYRLQTRTSWNICDQGFIKLREDCLLSPILILSSQESPKFYASFFGAGCGRISSCQENLTRNFEAREMVSRAVCRDGVFSLEQMIIARAIKKFAFQRQGMCFNQFTWAKLQGTFLQKFWCHLLRQDTNLAKLIFL